MLPIATFLKTFSISLSSYLILIKTFAKIWVSYVKFLSLASLGVINLGFPSTYIIGLSINISSLFSPPIKTSVRIFSLFLSSYLIMVIGLYSLIIEGICLLINSL